MGGAGKGGRGKGCSATKSTRQDVDFEGIGSARRAANITGAPLLGGATPVMMPRGPLQCMAPPPYAYAVPWAMMVPVVMPSVTPPIMSAPTIPPRQEACFNCDLREVEEAQKDIDKFHAEQTELALALSMERNGGDGGCRRISGGDFWGPFSVRKS